jgi:acetylornithine deacetylase/succinyl-diaminopimelate desuccinylase-like protein
MPSPDARLHEFATRAFEEQALPVLERYVAIPNRSPAFDPDWRAHGHMEEAVSLIADWCRARPLPGLRVERVQLGERTPVLWMELPGDVDRRVLLYGHLDKQPEMEGWSEGLGPWTPVRRGERLYGRGAADDGYAAFASLLALEALVRTGAPRPHCGVLIEACEESGSADLPAYVEHLAPRIGAPELVVCLDSGCGDYERLWSTTSLRGMVTGTLSVEVLSEGVHSGDAGGIVPESFRLLRALLSRVEDPQTGRLLLPELHVPIPDDRRRQAARAAEVLGEGTYRKFPFLPGAGPEHRDPTALVLARTWEPALAVTGLAGAPALGDAGNVLRPGTAVKLSFRLPPTADPDGALRALRARLEADPPCGARVRFSDEGAAEGWNAPALPAWLEASVDRASRAFFGQPAAHMGEGGSIPFMGMLGARFPEARFLVTGVLGPGSNAHGPNEFLHVPTAARLTACVAGVLADLARREA